MGRRVAETGDLRLVKVWCICYIMPRSLLECIQFVRRTAVQTAVHVITTGILIALLTGIAMKLRWFGPNP
jgi:hypothetical protein